MQDGGQPVRVKVDPETLRTLRLHQFTRVSGTLAPPADLVHTTQPAGPVTAVPKGPGGAGRGDGHGEHRGSRGAASRSTPGEVPCTYGWRRGPSSASPRARRCNVRISVQPVDLVPASSPASPAPAPVGTPAASPTSEPGDHAVVTGRIIGITGGVLVVESPTGPIQVVTADGGRYKVGDAVQVRTSVRRAP